MQPLTATAHVGEVRALGLLAGVELVADRATKQRYEESVGLGRKVKDELLSLGLCTRVTDDIICLAPPLVISEEEIDRLAALVKQAVRNTTGL